MEENDKLKKAMLLDLTMMLSFYLPHCLFGASNFVSTQ
jgi:hypothetical protein